MHVFIRIFFIFFSFFVSYTHALTFTFVVPSYNNEQHVAACLDSLTSQKTSHVFNIIYINDHSTDQTGLKAEEYVKNKKIDNITIIHNKKRVGALENIYYAVHMCPDETHIILVDGDDTLAHDAVIERVAYEYINNDAWITYGDFDYYNTVKDWSTPALPTTEIVTQDPYYFRQNGGQSHLRTFKASLFKKIKKEDLMENGEFFQMAWDTAIIVPMLEMSSHGHISSIPDTLYIYYFHNPLSDHNINRSLQHETDWLIRSKRPYAPLVSLEENAKYI